MIRFIEDEAPDEQIAVEVPVAPRPARFEFTDEDTPREPLRWPRWHNWAVGIPALLWSLVGAADYAMSEARNAHYLAMSARQLGVTVFDLVAYLGSIPAWAVAFWALGVWGAVTGSVLVLYRSRHAVAAFAISLAGLTAMTLYRLFGEAPEWARNDGAGQVAVWIFAVALLAYAITARRKGLLR